MFVRSHTEEKTFVLQGACLVTPCWASLAGPHANCSLLSIAMLKEITENLCLHKAEIEVGYLIGSF